MGPRAEDARFDSGAPPVRDLIERLGADMWRLFDAKVALLRLELRTELSQAVRAVALVVTGAVLVLVALAFLLIALALWIGELVGSAPGGFAITGGVVGLLGGGLAAWGARSLRTRHLVPAATLQELRRDVEWVKKVA